MSPGRAPGDRPAGGPGGDGRARRPFNYVALVGVLFVAVIVIAAVNALRTTDSGTVGIGEVGIGEPIAPFAVPVAASELDGDANIDPDRACEVAGEDVIRICDFFGKPLVISFWWTRGGSDCVEQQDVFDRVAARFRGRAGMLSINVRDDRDRVRELIEEHRWRAPVGYDRDGAVSNVYRVGVCPTTLFVDPDGVLRRAEVGRAAPAELTAQVRSLIDGAQEEEKAPGETGPEAGGDGSGGDRPG